MDFVCNPKLYESGRVYHEHYSPIGFVIFIIKYFHNMLLLRKPKHYKKDFRVILCIFLNSCVISPLMVTLGL